MGWARAGRMEDKDSTGKGGVSCLHFRPTISSDTEAERCDVAHHFRQSVRARD